MAQDQAPGAEPGEMETLMRGTPGLLLLVGIWIACFFIGFSDLSDRDKIVLVGGLALFAALSHSSVVDLLWGRREEE